MKIFTVGPVESYPESGQAYKHSFSYFRAEEYSNLVKGNLARLGVYLGAPTQEGVFYLTASGSGAMEAVVTNCIGQNEKALVINGGTFGKRFCEILEYYNIAYEPLSIPFGETLKREMLEEYSDKGFTCMLVNLHETSTGQLYDINLIAEFCRSQDIYLYVDAISTFLADEYNMKAYGIDATIISSQKGLCLSPGLSFIALSERQMDKCRSLSSRPPLYFKFSNYLAEIARGQTPFTPAVGIMYELANMLDKIEREGGLSSWLEGIRQKSTYFRREAKKRNFTYPAYPLSNMLTPLVFTKGNAWSVYQALRDEYGFTVNPCGGSLKNTLLRIGHIGNLCLQDFDALLDALGELERP